MDLSEIFATGMQKKIQELQQQVNNTRVAAASEQGELM
jgi:DNA-binding protein YbaB